VPRRQERIGADNRDTAVIAIVVNVPNRIPAVHLCFHEVKPACRELINDAGTS
jgi:hypothetical protein